MLRLSLKVAKYDTYTSPIMHLICPPPPKKKKNLHKHFFNFTWDGCNTQEKLRKGYAIFFFFGGGGGGRGRGMKCIMGGMLVAYAVADPGEGPATPYPLSFRPN